MIRQAYCSLEALEDVYAFSEEEEYNALYTLLEAHHSIRVHLAEDEFEAQKRNSECLRILIKRATSRKGYSIDCADANYQDVLAATTSEGLAGTVFVVDDTPVACNALSKNYGVCIISKFAPLDASYLTKELARKEVRLKKNYRTSVVGNEREGWNSVLTPRPEAWQQVPMNALVIVDNYLLGEKGDKLEAGQENLISLLDAIMPPALEVDFHLLLVTNNSNSFLNAQNLSDMSKEIRKKLGKPYRIEIGVVTRYKGSEHRRALVSNYYFGASHHGFSCFKGQEALWANDLIVSGIFSGVAEVGYDVPWISMHDELRAVRIQRDANLNPRNANAAYQGIHLAYGFCNNRLLSLV